MIKKKIAVEIKEYSLRAVTELTGIFEAMREGVSDEDYAVIKRGVGLSIGRIQTEILDSIYRDHPDLDHLKD